MDARIAALVAASLTTGCTAMARAPAADPAGAPTAMVAAIRADAERRAGVAEGQSRIEEVRAVIWRDGALGCPSPGMMYTQALVPGWKLRVAAGAQTLHYHASRRGQWLWCPAERVQEPLPGDAAR
jgi:cytochrome c5